MNYNTYLKLFEEILNSEMPESPYTDPKYLHYAKLNFLRMNRWQKTLDLNLQLLKELKKINRAQQWIIIAEPWCGDAAAIVPFLVN